MRTTAWSRSVTYALVLLLLGAFVPLVPVAAQTADNGGPPPCTGTTAFSYDDECGPPFTIPTWSDASGWTNPQNYQTIMLADFNGDGTDELLARATTGFVIFTWDATYGQWLDMGVQTFPSGWGFNDNQGWDQAQFYSTIQAAYLGYLFSEAASLLMMSVYGIVAFQWDGQQTWTELPAGPDWVFSDPAGYTTIQTWKNWMIANTAEGVETWQFAYDAWGQIDNGVPYPVFSSDANWDDAAYYSTLKLVDLDGDDQPELVARTGAGLTVSKWGGGGLQTQGWRPFATIGVFSDDAGWNQPQYYETIMYGELDGAYGMSIVARGGSGMLVIDWAGGNWSQLPTYSPLFSDDQGWNEAQYYQTLQLVTLLPNTTLLVGRGPDGLEAYTYDQPDADFNQVFNGPALSDGPNEDYLLWAQPSYYETIHFGDIDGDTQTELIARGQFGVRTWDYVAATATWQRPLAYGFPAFSDPGQGAAFELVNSYLNIAQGSTIRDAYSSLDSQVALDYQECLTYSLQTGQAQPPTDTCYLLPPEQDLANPNGVTAAQWQAMVQTLQTEIAMAAAISGYFNESLSGVLNDLFAGNQNSLANIANQLSIDQQAQTKTLAGAFSALFVGLAAALANLGGPEAQFAVDALGASMMAVGSVSSPSSSSFNTSLANVQAQLEANNTSAIDQNNASFQYVAQDYGLLYLVGQLVTNQTWLITAGVQNAMVSAGRWHFANWTFQTLLPTVWAFLQFVCGGSSGSDCPEPTVQPGYVLGHAGQGAYLARVIFDRSNFDFIFANDPVAVELFSPIGSGCYLADGQGTWNYGDCNLGLDPQVFFELQDGWLFRCAINEPANPLQTCPDVTASAVAPYSAAGDMSGAASVNPGSSDVLHTAVLSSTTFDARSIDPTTASLAGAPVVGWWVGNSDLNPGGTANWPAGTLSEVNGDGLMDVLLNFHQAAIQVDAGDTEAYIVGETTGGATFMAILPIAVTGP